MSEQQKFSHPSLRQLFPSPWPAVWTWIFAANVILGIFSPQSFTLAFIRISGILLCLVYVVQFFTKDRLLIAAMLTTFIADCILAANNTAEIGIIFFVVAQMFHLYRLDHERMRYPILSLLAIIIITIICDLIWHFAPLIHVICAFYLFLICTNIYVSWRWYRQDTTNPRALMSFLGFILFLCCDICTGISYLSLQNTFPAFCYAPANFFAWFFYYPSQILVSNSSKCAIMKHKGR